MVSIGQEHPDQPEIARLLRESDAFAAALYPPETCYMIDTAALARPNVRFFVARLDGAAVGCGAVVLAEDGTAEIKRMFVDGRARGQGVARRLLDALETAARNAGAAAICLETGTRSDAALALYRRAGYRDRGPFGAYKADAYSVFMEKKLPPA